MEGTPLYKRPWFYIAGWLAFLLVIYFWQIFRMGGIQASVVYIFVDLICVFPILLILWMGFFSQFILPVHTFSDRSKIFSRLIDYLFKLHGPALFIENGIIKEHSGERLKKGPGVVWLDTASAAVTRTSTKIKQTIGLGVHFIEKNEYIEGTIDLHIQNLTLGPKETDQPFAPKKDEQTDAEYFQIQERRKEVSAWTRDGILVVPNISVTFRVATGFPRPDQPGSRFGYRTGITKKAKEEEAEDKKAIYKAVLGEGVNFNAPLDSPRRRVAWNILPGLLAVDVWREYVARFTFDELFNPTQLVVQESEPPSQPTEQELEQLTQAVQLRAEPNRLEDGITSILREVNKFLEKAIGWVEGKKTANTLPPVTPDPSGPISEQKNEPQKKTALQVITEMVTDRLTKAKVKKIGDHGESLEETIKSREFELLKDRGLSILSVSISNIRFEDKIEEQLVSKWKATWFNNAKQDQDRINRKINFAEIASQEYTGLKYINTLSRHIMSRKPGNLKETLQILLLRSRLTIIRDNQLQRQMISEREEIEKLLQWLENGP